MNQFMKLLKNKVILKIIKFLFVLIFLIIITTKIDLKIAIDILKGINGFIFLYLFISMSVLFLVSLRWKEILKTKKVKPRVRDLFFYKLSELYMNYITPSAFVGGEPVKAYLLKKDYNVEYSKGVSTAIIDKSFDIAINLIIGTIVFLLLSLRFVNKFGIFLTTLVTFFLFSAIIILGIIIFNYYKGNKILHYKLYFLANKDSGWAKKIYRFICEFENHVIDFFHKEKDILLKNIMISIIISIVMYLEYFFLLKTLGIPYVGAFFPIIVLSMLGIAYLVPLPGAIGSLELFETLAFVMFKLPPEAAVAFVIFIRMKDILLALLGIIYLMLKGVKLYNVKEIKEKEDKNSN